MKKRNVNNRGGNNSNAKKGKGYARKTSLSENDVDDNERTPTIQPTPSSKSSKSTNYSNLPGAKGTANEETQSLINKDAVLNMPQGRGKVKKEEEPKGMFDFIQFENLKNINHVGSDADDDDDEDEDEHNINNVLAVNPTAAVIPAARTVAPVGTIVDKVLFKMKINRKKLKIVIMHPETLRIVSYLMFWFMVGVSILATKLYVDPKLVEDSALVHTLGYNNICVYFDYYPSLYIAAMIYPFVELPFFAYIFLDWLRVRKAGKLGLVTRKFQILSSVLTFFELVFVAWFRMIFVVHINISIFYHTAAFVSLQVGLIINAIHGFLYYTHVVKFTKRQYFLLSAYVISLIAVTFIKNVFTQSALLGKPVLNYSNPTHVELAKGFDIAWMILGAVVPVYLAYQFKKDSPWLTFTF